MKDAQILFKTKTHFFLNKIVITDRISDNAMNVRLNINMYIMFIRTNIFILRLLF